MPSSYKVRNLLDVARMPQEAWPRFIKELPEMLGMLHHIDKIAQEAAKSENPKEQAEALRISEENILSSLTWIDDGKQDFDVTLRGQTQDGVEHMKIQASTRTRDASAVFDGKDITYDILIAGKLREAGFVLEGEDASGIMPEGKVILPAGKLVMIKDMTPEGFAELCISANRKLEIQPDPDNQISKKWSDVADVI